MSPVTSLCVCNKLEEMCCRVLPNYSPFLMLLQHNCPSKSRYQSTHQNLNQQRCVLEWGSKEGSHLFNNKFWHKYDKWCWCWSSKKFQSLGADLNCHMIGFRRDWQPNLYLHKNFISMYTGTVFLSLYLYGCTEMALHKFDYRSHLGPSQSNLLKKEKELVYIYQLLSWYTGDRDFSIGANHID